MLLLYLALYMHYNGNIDVFYVNYHLKEHTCGFHPNPDVVEAKALDFSSDKIIWPILVS